MPPTLQTCFTLRVHISQSESIAIGAVRGGLQRTLAATRGGDLTGEGVEAELLPGTGDWLLVDPTTNTLRPNVRLTLRTKQGNGIYIRYGGIMKINEKAAAALSLDDGVAGTDYGEIEFFTHPIIETNDLSLKWAETASFVAEGRWVNEVGGRGLGLEYCIYRLMPSSPGR